MNMKQRKTLIAFFVVLVLSAIGLPAQTVSFDDEELGDTAIAEKYLLWAEDAIAAGNWSQAHAALERAADFSNVSSDLSYLLAIARSHENESRRLVLHALERAIAVGKWNHYTPAQARLMEADQLIALRRYSAAIDTLEAYKTIAGESTTASGDADAALLRLAALKGLGSSFTEPRPRSLRLPVPAEFRRYMLETLDRYPRDPRPMRLLFDYFSVREPVRDDIPLMEIALKRLPFLLESDQELAWMAAPFIGDTSEARRLVAAYRAGTLKSRQDPAFKPHPASIIPALNLGLIDDTAAIDELFTQTILDKDIIINIGGLLRSEEGRNHLARNLHSFTGEITENEDRDDYPESRAVYYKGGLQEYYFDADQDGITDLYVAFITGTPQHAELAAMPTVMTQKNGNGNGGTGREQALVRWERYPSVLRTELGDEVWLPAPGGFPFAPIVFEEIGTSDTYAGLLFPRVNPRGSGVNRRMLAYYAVSVRRPSAEFEGGIEQVFFTKGIPIRAEVTRNGLTVSVTEYENGYPVLQRLDMDMDGRMETVRQFDRRGLRSVETDWRGDGLFGSAELYRGDGSVVYSWDMDGDGSREYSERK
jgi:tetratricopeptide (TPR) repeat protein